MPHRSARLRPSFLVAVVLLLAGWAGGTEVARPLIDLDASTLKDGAVQTWLNAGALGGEFKALSEAPTASTVSGRRAVRTGENRFFASSIKAPSEITGNHPFTVSVWALTDGPLKREVMVSWASRPNNTAEFGYGTGPDGGFFGWDKSQRFGHVPATGQWHQITYVYDGQDLRIDVDGLPDASRPMKLAIKPGGTIYVGGGWNGVDQKQICAFDGAIARLKIWDSALSLRQIRNDAGWDEAFSPTPQDGATIPAEGLKLSWEQGSDAAAAYAVRVQPEKAAASLDQSAPQQIRETQFSPAGIAPGLAYVWRVDQVDGSGNTIAAGKVWHFTTDSGPAAAPMPRDEVAGVSVKTASLHWTPGRYAKAQTLYFGTGRQTVADGHVAKPLPVAANVSECAVPSGSLEFGKTYYWRVAQDNGGLPTNEGQVWSFRTEDLPIKDDVTFFVGSDCHYGLGNNDELNRKVIDEMNRLPGTPMPPQAGGGIVRTPRGVVLDGDLLDKGFDPKIGPPAWAEFVQDYGLTGHDGRLGYPVYEGFGNHDGMTGKSFSRAGIKERNKSRVGLTMVSSNGFHYSWDWDQVHCDQLNLFPGKDSADCIVGPPNHNPEDSLGFVKSDLEKNVGTSGRLVVIFCHYCYSGGMADWWTQPAKQRFYDAIKGYRVLLIHGHSHGAYFYNWNGIQVLSDGATARPEGQTGDFLVVHITSTELSVAQRKLGDWGITLHKPLPSQHP